jgi:hypothetical protein
VTGAVQVSPLNISPNPSEVISIFMLLRSPCKISEPYDNPFWENDQRAQREREEEEKKKTIIKGSLHFKYKFTLKCAKMCTDMPAINIYFQKSVYHLSEANRA